MPTHLSPLPFAIRAELFLHLATMERAGLPVDKAFANLRLPGTAQTRVIATIAQLQRGKDIPSAGAAAGLFDTLETSLLRAAVSAGSPSISYQRLADRYALKTKLQKKIRSRLALPCFMLCMSLILSVLPTLITGNLSVSAALWKIIMPLALLAGLFYLGKTIYRAMTQQYQFNALLLQIPYFGALHRRVNLRDYFETLALMLEAGMPMLEALPKANKSMHSPLLQKHFSSVYTHVKQGKALAQALEYSYQNGAENRMRNTSFEEMSVLEIIRTGEASGTLPSMLTRYAEQESLAISMAFETIAAWLPRVIYAMVAIWVIIGIFSSSAFMPKVV